MSSVFIRRMIVAGGRELPRRQEFWTRTSPHLSPSPSQSSSLSLISTESDPDPSLSQHLLLPPQVLFSSNPFTTTITPHTHFGHNHYHIPLPPPHSYPPFLDASLFAPMPAVAQVEAPTEKVPTFSPNDVTVIFVLGGPGVGKGTQCANLVKDYGFVHLSAGDLLREEQNRQGSEFGDLIKTHIREGKIVPMEVTVALLESAMKEAIKSQGKSKFLIDGFPRKLDQAYKFEQEVCPSAFTLFFDTTEDVMLARLLKRGETSGRTDDNIESIRKRFRTFKETSYPVVEHFRTLGKVVDVDAADSPVGVYAHVKEQLKGLLETVEKQGV